MKNLFESYLAIDWSGAETVHTKSIAMAEIKHSQNSVQLMKPTKSKLWSRTDVHDYLYDMAKSGRRIFVGIDANFSIANSILMSKLPAAQNVYDLWQEIDKICMQNKNFYAKDFWTHHNWSNLFWTQGSCPPNFPKNIRETEQICANYKLGNPENPFKLIGTKQVGKGGLSAMRLMNKLRHDLGELVAFWPFDSSDRMKSSNLVFAEIYPRLFIKSSGHGQKKIRMISDLNLILSNYNAVFSEQTNFSDHEADAIIAAAGIKNIISNNKNCLELTQFNEKIAKEGWILGV